MKKRFVSSCKLLASFLGVATVATFMGSGAALPAAKGNLRGSVLDDAATTSLPVGENTEAKNPAPVEGYSISVDGEVVAGARTLQDTQRKTDLALEEADIQVKFDGLEVKPVLNVSTVPVRRTYVAGEDIKFFASLNYRAWITHAEIRIFPDQGRTIKRPVAVLPLSEEGMAAWRMPASGTADFYYVLRVYDGEGRFDETLPLTLARSNKALPPHEPQDAVAPGYGEDRTGIRNIPVYGGAVTVFGNHVGNNQSVFVMGEHVPVDAEGKFVIQRILPPGDHHIDVGIHGEKSAGVDFTRDINIPSSEWFYVALADLTAGYRWNKSDIQSAKPGEFDSVYSKGRAAFYVKGKIKGSTILTAAADTGEGNLKELFRGLDAKDPRQFLHRIDPDDYYPVYGDDSTAVEDAPTRGKFYVRLERGDSRVMWGNFKTSTSGTEFLRNERALYGAQGVYKSSKQAPDGGRTTELNAYAAQPGTLPQRDELRGTGGSTYFLKYQDVTIGSETVNIEIRDGITGRVLERTLLRYGIDFDFDYVQGLILLRKPLQSTSSASGVVRNGALGGNPIYLVVAYEFTPAAGDVDGYVFGGRAQQWIDGHFRLGATAQREKTGSANQTLYGTDIRLGHSPETYLEGEVAQSKGPGFGISRSSDGGLTISDTATAGSASKTANAYRAELKANLGEISNGVISGDVDAYYRKWDSGFSSLSDQVANSKQAWGGHTTVKLGDRLSTTASYAEARIEGGKHDRELAAETAIEVTDELTLTTGVRHSTRRDFSAPAANDGSRTDVGGKIAFIPNEDGSVYAFGQTTVARSGQRNRNDRAGVGGKTKLSEKVSLAAEASVGTSGMGGLAELNYQPTADDSYSLGYRIDPDRHDDIDSAYELSGEDLGTVVAGVRHRFNDKITTFAEDSYDLFGDRRTLAQAYGVEYSPSAAWTLTGGAEIGEVVDDTINQTTGLKNSDFKRKAVSLAASFKDESERVGRVKGEIRDENSQDQTRDMTSYLVSASVGVKTNENWRFLGNLDAVISNATATTRDGKYLEASLGYAYRPTDNDRLNGLFKYSFLYDLPGADQVTVNGSTKGPAQVSHIMSADMSYDVTPILTIGGKYGFRIGEIKERDGTSDWVKSSAHLAVVRADINVVKDWDAMVEGRLLWTPKDGSKDLGLLAAVYRHVGDNFKIGVGYNFGSFSDDLRDLTHDDQGIFINAIGKF